MDSKTSPSLRMSQEQRTDNKNKTTVELWNKKDNIIKSIPLDTAVFEIYYLRYRVPTKTEITQYGKSKITVDEIKNLISTSDSYIPLYDAFTSNIYIVQRRNVYIRVINHDYRFPDALIMESVKTAREKKLAKLKKRPELKDDKVFVRGIRKADLMIEFMEQFDKEILYNTYLDIFYRYAPEIGNATYTCIRKSFMPHKSHLKPYYTRDEVIKLGMNMDMIHIPDKISYADFKDSLTPRDYKNMCSNIQTNDVSAEILIDHQNYIVEQDMVGLIQYYTIQGSYFMNQYMRGMTKYEYRNEYLEENIKKMWELVLNAPKFDNDYILYRFVSTDDYLRHLRIGDVYTDKGFTSTTRDPFYRNDLYKFGFILIKIKIPKGIKGVGLCLETLSHFPFEEEIILPPMSDLKLIAKDDDCEYHHPDEDFVSNIKTRYEFEWIGNNKISFPRRSSLPKELETKIIDFLSIDKVKTITIREKIDFLIKRYFDPMNRIKCTIGTDTFYVVGEWYDSTGPYEEMYSIKTSEGFSLYSIYQGYILFMIEIGEIDGRSQIKVNYYTKYSRLNRQEIMGDDNFIKFVSSIAHYFDIPNVVIYADFMSCDKLAKRSKRDMERSQILIDQTFKQRASNGSSNGLSIGYRLYGGAESDEIDTETHSDPIDPVVPKNSKKQRTYMKIPDKPHSYLFSKKTKQDNKTNDKNRPDLFKNQSLDVTLDSDDTITGGSYCLDFYKYLKYDEKRYHNTNTLNVELQPKFSYHDLDLLKTVSPSKILRKEDRDEIYQIYVKNYVLDTSPEKDNLADFYIWMIEHKCYLMDIFIKKMDVLYREDNPFKKGMYALDAMAYLYNRRYVNTYSRYIKMMIDEEHQLLTLPKNDYRIRR